MLLKKLVVETPDFESGEETTIALKGQHCYTFVHYQPPRTKAPHMSTITYQYRIKDSTSGPTLARMASAVNYCWNYANEISMFAAHRDKRWLSAFDLITLMAGTSKALGIHTDTQSEICREYATRRKQYKAFRLAWRSKKRSLGWVPFKGRCVHVDGDTVTYCGYTSASGTPVHWWGPSKPAVSPRMLVGAGTSTSNARWTTLVNPWAQQKSALTWGSPTSAGAAIWMSPTRGRT
jgi:hypothetical protein